jgi:uncharacterized lipoprotein YmbA
MNTLRSWGRVRLVLSLSLLAFLTGCLTSKPSNFYSLTSVAQQSAATANGPAVDVTLEDFPGYLSTPQIVRMQSDTQLTVEEYERWAEELKKNFERTLAENLGTLLDSSEIYVYPRQSPLPSRCKLTIDVQRFELDSSGSAQLKARWHLVRATAQSPGTTRPKISSYSQKPASQDRAAEVRALSQALGMLSSELAQALAAACS